MGPCYYRQLDSAIRRAISMTGLEQSVVRMKVMDSLRAPGPDALKQVAQTYNIAQYPGLLAKAVESSPLSTVEYVVNLYNRVGRSVNEVAQDGSGNTPLHVAVLRNRRDVAVWLLKRPDVDDTIADTKGLVAADLASDARMESALSHAQDQFAAAVAVRVKNAFRARDLTALERIYANPRVTELLTINGTDPDTGLTVLHEAAGENNSGLVKFILDHGGDPLVQDSKGRIPSDLTKDEGITRMLNQAAKSRAIMSQTTSDKGNSEAPSMAGFLKKWTNLTSGYKVRWFVLRNGTLSYFKRKEDANSERAVRGTMALRHANVRLDSSEKNKFEIKTANQRFFLKAAHPGETSRWVWALQNAIKWAKDVDKREKRHKRSQSNVSTAASATGASTNLTRQGSRGSRESHGSRLSQEAHPNNMFVNDLAQNHDEDDEAAGTSSEELDEEEEDADPVTADSMVARLNAVRELLIQLVSKATEPALAEAIVTAENSLDVLTSDIIKYDKRAKRRQQHAAAQLDRADKAERQWARNYRDLELNYERLDGELHALRQESDDEFFDAPGDDDSDFDVPVAEHQSHQEGEVLEPLPEQPAEEVAAENAAANAEDIPASESISGTNETKDVEAASQTKSTQMDNSASGKSGALAATGSASALDGSESETQAPSELTTLNEEATETLSENSQGLTEKQREIMERLTEQKSWLGYEDPPRTRLKIDADNRPRMSLWGILKNLIGRDMTRMTLPVTFNECTSLLQRSTEDMEYTDLLDKAAAVVDDPGLRMAYIVAFTASSYSSTINRVAKPFNPLLGETYEYARPDKGYRLMAEQVSHHPPVGALIAESRHWDFYGESEVDSKFYGRSFDINPLGLWYINLRPDAGADTEEELYSFRKVTSSVVGIMVGNPVVDNHGTMHIQNYKLGIVAEVTYKPRGWRGSSAYKLTGTIKDKHGKELYTVAGQWNDKIWTKKAGSEQKILLWQAHERTPEPFNLTAFAITLNALPDRLRQWLPPTDTRLRPDQRAMEEGRYDDASDEKARVEDKQRKARRLREAEGVNYSPQWFELVKHPVTGKDYYRPINDYWAQRRDHHLANVGDIF